MADDANLAVSFAGTPRMTERGQAVRDSDSEIGSSVLAHAERVIMTDSLPESTRPRLEAW